MTRDSTATSPKDAAELGFWHWSVHPLAVLMAAEVELAAWTAEGTKVGSGPG